MGLNWISGLLDLKKKWKWAKLNISNDYRSENEKFSLWYIEVGVHKYEVKL